MSAVVIADVWLTHVDGRAGVRNEAETNFCRFLSVSVTPYWRSQGIEITGEMNFCHFCRHCRYVLEMMSPRRSLLLLD